MAEEYNKYVYEAKAARNNYVYKLYKSGVKARKMVETPEIYSRIADMSGSTLSVQRIQQIILTMKKKEKRGDL